MQDASLYAQINPTFPEPEHLKCPRCDSPNTKFCYYNNYNLSQPRHFCKSCKRYWTKGGTLRNIPVGGASRKNTKRSSTTKKPPSSSPSSKAAPTASVSPTTSTSSASGVKACETGGPALDQGRQMLDMNGNFSTLLGSGNQGQFRNLIDGLNQNGSNLQSGELGNVHNPGSGPGSVSGETRDIDPQVGLQNNEEDNSSCWNGGNVWPGLAI